MGVVKIYHVRAAGPSKGARTLRFRNKFQGFSCIFASPSAEIAITEWYSRYITNHYKFIKSLIWENGKLLGFVLNSVSDLDQWEMHHGDILATELYLYKFDFDDKWNKHPTKNCYVSRENVRFDRDPTRYTLTDLILTDITIEFTE